ncbi:MAG: DUF2497 domain-containing protein [Alphaproteobacteria bacterium]|jgi:cell pole-organizing protein PopZ|nr:DUF2497 domain-containing protein [Alphaproteobacteria bacterium]
MSQGETAPEPSMDEILSSIRKIIAEDETTEEPPAASGDAAPRADEAPAPDGGDEDDILELTEDDEIAAAGAGERVDEPDDGGVETVAETGPLDLDGDPLDDDPAYAEAVEASELGAEPAASPPRGAAGGAGAAPALSEMLLDDGAATAANAPLQRLSAAMSQGAGIPGGERTIEAFLADLVRPELKAWLDRHLPGLVERIVEREIKKLVRDAQPE